MLLAATTILTAQSPKTTKSEPHSAAVEKPAPVPTRDTKLELLSIIAKQQEIQLQINKLESMYTSLLGRAQQLQKDHVVAEEALVKSAGLDPEKYEVTYGKDVADIKLSPKAPTAPATPSTEKK